MAKNIDDFDAAVAAILSRLYATFPNKTTVDAFELAGDADEATRETYASTVEFLRDEGFLSYGQRSGKRGLFAQVVLTAKGLALLGVMPASLSVRDGSEGLGSGVSALGESLQTPDPRPETPDPKDAETRPIQR